MIAFMGARFASLDSWVSSDQPVMQALAWICVWILPGLGIARHFSHPPRGLPLLGLAFWLSCVLATALALPAFLLNVTMDGYLTIYLLVTTLLLLPAPRGAEEPAPPRSWTAEDVVLGLMLLGAAAMFYRWADDVSDVGWEVGLQLVYVRQYASGLPLDFSASSTRPELVPPNLFFLWEFLCAMAGRLAGVDPVIAFLRARALVPVLAVSAFAYFCNALLGGGRRSRQVTLVVVTLCALGFPFLPPNPPAFETLTHPFRQVMAFGGSVHHSDTGMDILLPLLLGSLFTALRRPVAANMGLFALSLATSFFWHPREYFQIAWYAAIALLVDLLLCWCRRSARRRLRAHAAVIATLLLTTAALAAMSANAPSERTRDSGTEMDFKKARMAAFVQDLGRPASYFEMYPPFRAPFHGGGRYSRMPNDPMFFLWLGVSVLLLPLIARAGSQRENWVSLFFVTLWLTTLCMPKVQHLLVLATYSEILISQIRFLPIFGLVLLGAGVLALFRLLGALNRSRFFLVPACAAIGLVLAVARPHDAREVEAGLGFFNLLLACSVPLIVLRLTGRLRPQPRTSGPAWSALVVVLAVVALTLPATWDWNRDFLPKAMAFSRSPEDFFGANNPTGLSPALIDHLRNKVPVRSGIWVSPEPTRLRMLGPRELPFPFAALAAIFAPLYQTPLPGNVNVDADDFRLVTKGRHEIFDRALRPSTCDPGAVMRAMEVRGASFLLITGGGYADARACLAGALGFRVDFDDRAASLVLFKLAESAGP